MSMKLLVHNELVAICQLSPEASLSDWASMHGFISLTRTKDEVTVVCPQNQMPTETKVEGGWRMIQINEVVDLLSTGVLASIAAPLAKAEIGIYSLSTFNTDYTLVKQETLGRAVEVLTAAGFTVEFEQAESAQAHDIVSSS